MRKIPTIFLDMDGVLADFCTGVMDLFNLEPERVMQHWPKGEWDMVPAMNRAMHPTTVDAELFWQVIGSRGVQFWTALAELPWFEQLINLVDNYCEEWYIVTAPGPHPMNYAGKGLWLQQRELTKHLPLVPTNHKYLLAQPGTVLIDDSEKNCEEFEYRPVPNETTFRKTGGTAILFPAHVNELHSLSNDPVAYVRDQLQSISFNLE